MKYNKLEKWKNTQFIKSDNRKRNLSKVKTDLREI